MKILTIDHQNGHKTTYKLIPDGNDLPIAYHIDTPDDLVEALERARRSEHRIRVYLGDRETGKNWNEENDVIGRIGLSRGYEARFPILVYNERSRGGGSLMDNRIMKFKTVKAGITLWQDPKYKPSKVEVKYGSDHPDYTHEVWIDGQLYSRHKSEKDALKLKKHME